MVMSGREEVAIAVQTAIGTPVNPGILVPVIPGTFKASENFEQVLDKGRRGPDVADFGAYQGVGQTEITWDGLVQQGDADEKAVIGYLLDNLLGTGALATQAQIDATGNYDHRLIVGTTKEYLTVEHDSGGVTGANDRRFSGFRVMQLAIKFDAGEGALTYTVSGISRSPTSETAQSPADDTGAPWMGWQGVVTFGDTGASFTRLISGEITLTRQSQPFWSAQASRDITDIYRGELEVTMSLVLDYSVVTDLTDFRNKDQSPLAVLFRVGTEDAASDRVFAIGTSLADLGDGPAELDNSNPNVRLGLVARFLYTTGNGPFSSSSNAATAQNGNVQVQIVQPIDGIY